MWLPQWLTERLCTDLFTGHLHVKLMQLTGSQVLTCLLTLEGVGVLSCTGYPACRGSRTVGTRALLYPQLLCCITHHHPGSKPSGSKIKKVNQTQRHHTPPPTSCPKPPTPVSEKQGLQGGQEAASAACQAFPRLSPFSLTNTRLPVSALPPQTTVFLQPGWAGETYGSQSESCPAGSSLKEELEESECQPPGPTFLSYTPRF